MPATNRKRCVFPGSVFKNAMSSPATDRDMRMAESQNAAPYDFTALLGRNLRSVGLCPSPRWDRMSKPRIFSALIGPLNRKRDCLPNTRLPTERETT